MTDFDSKTAKIVFHSDSSYIGVYWKDIFFTKDTFVSDLNTCLEFLKEHKSTKILFDNTNAKLLSKENQEYQDNTFIPTLIQNGVKKIAIVVPQSVFTQMSLNKSVANAGEGITDIVDFKYFPKLSDAESWLTE